MQTLCYAGCNCIRQANSPLGRAFLLPACSAPLLTKMPCKIDRLRAGFCLALRYVKILIAC